MQLQRDKIEGEEIAEIQQKHHLTQASGDSRCIKIIQPIVDYKEKKIQNDQIPNAY